MYISGGGQDGIGQELRKGQEETGEENGRQPEGRHTHEPWVSVYLLFVETRSAARSRFSVYLAHPSMSAVSLPQPHPRSHNHLPSAFAFTCFDSAFDEGPDLTILAAEESEALVRRDQTTAAYPSTIKVLSDTAPTPRRTPGKPSRPGPSRSLFLRIKTAWSVSSPQQALYPPQAPPAGSLLTTTGS